MSENSSTLESKRGIPFVLAAVMINSIGIGLMMPVLPGLIQELTDNPVSAAAVWGGYLSFSYAIMQFAFSPLVGNLSDRFGRKPILLISLFALGVDYLIMALAPSILVLFIGRLLSGIAGATFSTANAYIADVSPPDKRAQNFGLIGAAFGIGFILGPALGGFLGEFGLRVPFYAAAIISFCNFAFGYWFVPESLAPENRREFEVKRANPLGAMEQIRKFPTVAVLFIVSFLYGIAHMAYPAIWAYFAIESYDWTSKQVGFSLALVGIGFAFTQGYLIRKMIPKFGAVNTAKLGLALNIFVFVGFGLFAREWMFYALLPFMAVSAVFGPALNSLMSNRIPDDAQGELQGALSSINGVALIVSPLVMTQVFGYFSGSAAPFYLPGAPFLLAGILAIAAWFVLLKGLNTKTTTPNE